MKSNIISPLTASHLQYPIARNIYCFIVGEKREQTIRRIFIDMGFSVEIHKVSENGVDIIVKEDGKILLVAEVLNWWLSSTLMKDRASQIVKNLMEYPNVPKILIYSFSFMTSTARELLDENGIVKLETGFQTLPGPFYEFYAEKGEAVGRMRDSRQSYDIVRNKILRLLKRLKILEAPMYVKSYITYSFGKKHSSSRRCVGKIIKKIRSHFAAKDPPFKITELTFPNSSLIYSHSDKYKIGSQQSFVMVVHLIRPNVEYQSYEKGKINVSPSISATAQTLTDVCMFYSHSKRYTGGDYEE